MICREAYENAKGDKQASRCGKNLSIEKVNAHISAIGDKDFGQ